jgi:hypothetical protein
MSKAPVNIYIYIYICIYIYIYIRGAYERGLLRNLRIGTGFAAGAFRSAAVAGITPEPKSEPSAKRRS